MIDTKQLLLLFARANDFKEGDLTLGGTDDDFIRKIAQNSIENLTISDIYNTDFVEDKLSETLKRSINKSAFKEISHLKIIELKNILLGSRALLWHKKYSSGLPSEAIAALVKTMSNEELSIVANSIFNSNDEKSNISGKVTIGTPNHFGSRIQPNSAGDETDEILLSTLEGLCYGCGDVIIGINLAADNIETIIETEKLLQSVVDRFQLPTRYCVLSEISKQKMAAESTKVDVGFQSLAGTSKGLMGMAGCDVDELLDYCCHFKGLYFETGQGSEITNGVAENTDMVTLEARCYGLARHIKHETNAWMIVNDVAGFIGPEVFSTAEQLKRTCLEDTVMAKLHGLVFGLDVCSTFHMGIHPSELQKIAKEIVVKAAPAYLMAVAGQADPMLGYLTTSFREHNRLRSISSKTISTEMQKRLIEIGALNPEGEIDPNIGRIANLYAYYHKAGNDKRSMSSLIVEAMIKIKKLQVKGCDIGYGLIDNHTDPMMIKNRLDELYKHARNALYAKFEATVMNENCSNPIHISTNASSRDAYIAHPTLGEKINYDDSVKLKSVFAEYHFENKVQFVISDGLNANSINEHLPSLLPELKRKMYEANVPYNPVDIIVTNGRVRAGYDIGQLIEPEILVHFIGERPGTGLNQLSAYITYGRNDENKSIFSSEMDHSLTTAVCSIHPYGKFYKNAIKEIVEILLNAFKTKKTGIQ